MVVLAALGLAVLLGGCAALPPTNAQSLVQLKSANQGRVIAPTASSFAGLDIGSHIDMGINSVNGTSVWTSWSGDKAQVDLSAGKHELDVHCRYVSASVVVGKEMTTTQVEVTVEGGHVYQLKAVAGDLQTCKAGIQDITDQIAAGGVPNY